MGGDALYVKDYLCCRSSHIQLLIHKSTVYRPKWSFVGGNNTLKNKSLVALREITRGTFKSVVA